MPKEYRISTRRRRRFEVLAGGQIDAPQAGIPKQGGESHFMQRFAFQTHTRFSPSAAMKFSRTSEPPGCRVGAGRQSLSRSIVFVAYGLQSRGPALVAQACRGWPGERDHHASLEFIGERTILLGFACNRNSRCAARDAHRDRYRRGPSHARPHLHRARRISVTDAALGARQR